MSTHSTSLKRQVLPILIFVVSLCFTWYTAYVYANTIMDSDSSSELVLANLLSQQNAILTTDWYYSSELRVIQTNLVFAPLFSIFSSWHTVRFVGDIILQAIMLLSYYFLSRQAQVSLKAFFYSAAILILPFSVQYGRIVLFHTYYLPFVTFGFLLVGLYLALMRSMRQTGKRVKPRIYLALLLVVSFLAGLNGLRQLMVTMAPMLLASVLVTYHEEKSPAASSPKTFLYRWRWIWGSLLSSIFACLGLFSNNLLSQHYSFKDYTGTMTHAITADDLLSMIHGFFSQFGFQADRPLLTVEGMLACGGVFVALYVSISGAKRLLQPRDGKDLLAQEHSGVNYLAVFFPIAISLMILVFSFTGITAYYYLYFIPVVVWVVPFIAVLINEIHMQSRIQKLLFVFIYSILLCNGFYNNAYFLNPSDKPVVYEGLGRKEINTVQKLRNAVDFLQDNGYTLGYSSYWQTNVITEMTNGMIPMVNVAIDQDNPSLSYHNWLTVNTYQEEAFVEDKNVFLLLPLQQNDTFLQTPLSDTATPVYQDESYIIYDFEYATDPWNALQE